MGLGALAVASVVHKWDPGVESRGGSWLGDKDGNTARKLCRIEKGTWPLYLGTRRG